MILDDVTSSRGDGYIMGFLYHEMIQYNGDPTNNLGILIVGKKTLDSSRPNQENIWDSRNRKQKKHLNKSRFDVLNYVP
jgi:hypothetical protein